MANDTVESRERTPGPARPIRRRLASGPLTLIGATLAILFVANTVWAWGRGGDRGIDGMKAHAEHFLDHALERLDATDEQSTAIRTIVMSTIDELESARADRRSERAEFLELMTAESIDRAKLEALRAAHVARADQMSRIVTTSLADVMDVLTPDQRTQLEEHIKERAGRHARHDWFRP
jgi:Spy/CpxP family protein refolding chaperone